MLFFAIDRHGNWSRTDVNAKVPFPGQKSTIEPAHVVQPSIPYGTPVFQE